MKAQKTIELVVVMSVLVLGLILAQSEATAFANEANGNAVDLRSIKPQSVESVTIYPQSITIDRNAIKFSLCLDLPDTGDWMPVASIAAGNLNLKEVTVSLQNFRDPGTMASLHRCYDLAFPNQEIPNQGRATVTVNRLERLIDPLTETGYQEVLGKVQQDYPGFDFEIVVELGKMGGGAFVNILANPDGFSEAEVYEMIDRASREEVLLNAAFDVVVP